MNSSALLRFRIPACCLVVWALVASIFAPAPARAQSSEAARRPSLVVLITVDQLRGDLLTRYRSRFGPGGFQRLLDSGVHFTNAHYRHSSTFTAVGHATIATGGQCEQHGYPGNSWIDRKTGKPVYCCADDRHQLVGAPAGALAASSPRFLTCTTFGDELVVATAERSRVFSVAIKDRGAVIPAGRLGTAFWYHWGLGQFVSSSYYLEDGKLPAWARAWNDAKPADAYRGKTWDLLYPRNTYVYRDRDNQPFEMDSSGLGRVFPHPLDHEDDATYYGLLRVTPMGDELTLSFVKALLAAEPIGTRETPDILAVSFSATDYIGHTFGPESLEYEDNLMRLDRTIAGLLSEIDKRVGLDRCVVALTSDHGIASVPELRQSYGFDAPRISGNDLIPRVEAALEAKFGNKRPLVIGFRNVGIYLDHAAIRAEGLDAREVEKAAVIELRRVPGIAHVLSRLEILEGKRPLLPDAERVRQSFHRDRSGDILIAQQPHAFLYYRTDRHAAMHGSPYSYDTHVPVIFMGPGLRPRTVHRRVEPNDIAPTITSWLGVPEPSGCVGVPLPEALP